MAYLVVEYRLSWVAGAILLHEVIEIGVFDGLTQREHLVGVGVGVGVGTGAGVIARMWRRAGQRSDRRGPGATNYA